MPHLHTPSALPVNLVNHTDTPQRHPVHERVSMTTSTRPIRVGFLYNAQIHQIPHSASIAFELSLRHPEVQVTIIAPRLEQLSFIQDLAKRYPGHRCTYTSTDLPALVQLLCTVGRHRILETLGTLVFNRALFSSFDALVVPERTSLYLKRMGCQHVKFIHADHGIGDRARGFEDRIRKFDFLLVQGQKQVDRLGDLEHIRSGRYAITGYPKFDLFNRQTQQQVRLFPNDNPVVLYNPHCHARLSSWKTMGEDILDFFAGSPSYNLIFAPHVKLFDRAGAMQEKRFKRYWNAKNILIDLGSRSCVDMTYTLAADIYLGDVSSQVYEFLMQPRPCIFLNSHHAEWINDPNYLCWQCGPVLTEPDMLADTLATAQATHASYIEAQKAVSGYSYDASTESTGARAADAIATYLSVDRSGRFPASPLRGSRS